MYWHGKLPLQGWLYLTVNRLCFYAYILGKEHRVILRWTEVTSLNKTNSLVFPESIKITTVDDEVIIGVHLEDNIWGICKLSNMELMSCLIFGLVFQIMFKKLMNDGTAF